MKKTIAALLAMTTVLSVGMTALASDVNVKDIIDAPVISALETNTTEGEGTDNNDSTNNEGTDNNDGANNEGADNNNGTENDGTNSDGTGEEDATPVGDPSALVFGADASTGAVLGSTVLEPGTTYKFPVSLQFGDKAFAMTEDMIKDYKFTYTRLSSASVSDFEITESKGVYYLNVTVKSVSPLKPVDVKYNIKMVKKADNMALFAQEVSFQYGFENANDDYIDSLDKGDVIEIDNTNPILTTEQFNTIAKINDYKNVTIAGPSWTLNVNVTDETTKNLFSNHAGVKEILAKYTDNEFKFFNFTGKPVFNAAGKLALDVSDIEDDYANLYTYRYANGKLYRINATHNTDDSTVEFRTNTLDTFLITDKLIQDGSVIVENVAGDSTSDSNTTTDSTEKPVPETGACQGGFFANLCQAILSIICR